MTSFFTKGIEVIKVDASQTGGDLTYYLPDAEFQKGSLMCIIKTDSSGNDVIVTPQNSQTISGSVSVALPGQGDSILFTSDGSNYFVIASYSI